MAAHRILYDLIILRAAEKDADAGVFMRALPISIKCLQIEG
jgi:hypothetical protein